MGPEALLSEVALEVSGCTRCALHAGRTRTVPGEGNPISDVLLVGEGEPYRAREVAKLLQVPVVASLSWDPEAAAVLAKGAEPPRPSALQRLADRNPFDDSALLRSVRAARTAVQATIATNRDHLQAAPAGRQM